MKLTKHTCVWGAVLVLGVAACDQPSDEGKDDAKATTAETAKSAEGKTKQAAEKKGEQAAEKPALKGYDAVEAYFKEVKMDGFGPGQVSKRSTAAAITLKAEDAKAVGVNEVRVTITKLSDIGNKEDVTWNTLEDFKKKFSDPDWVKPPTKASEFTEIDLVDGTKAFYVKKHPVSQLMGGKKDFTEYYVYLLKSDYKRDAYLMLYDEDLDLAKTKETIQKVAEMMAKAPVGSAEAKE